MSHPRANYSRVSPARFRYMCFAAWDSSGTRFGSRATHCCIRSSPGDALLRYLQYLGLGMRRITCDAERRMVCW